MDGTIAITDHGWYERLAAQPGLDEVNFWKPTATRAFRAPECSPFLFKLRAEHGHAICGFGFFARYARLPDWLAWETFGLTNGCASLDEMRARIGGIRHRIRFAGRRGVDEIGSILILQPTFFPRPLWVAGPRDWKDRTQTPMRYDLSAGEGARVWQECLAAAGRLGAARDPVRAGILGGPRFGTPTLVRPRLGQGTFRIAVMDAYDRACAVTGEHSLPALEAAHIRPFSASGPHEVGNGVLLRADLHRLFDKGYVSIDANSRLLVSDRLKDDFSNGRSYYPLRNRLLELPTPASLRPAREFIDWHREQVFLG